MLRSRALLLLFLVHTSAAAAAAHKVAVVGGGIGGTSTAYFLKKLFRDKSDVKVKVFEPEEVGGRLRKMDIGGVAYDSGGSVIHSVNFYAKTLTHKVGLKEEELTGGSTAAFYDGSKYVLKLTGNSFKDKFKVLGRYGFGVRHVLKAAEKLTEMLNKIYCLQNHKMPFTSVSDLLNTTHPDLLKKVLVDMKTDLTKDGVSELIQNELVAAALRTNYNQHLGVNAFVGYVSLAGGFVGSLWRIKDGNYQLPEAVLEKSGAELVKSKVTKITKTGSGYVLSYTTSDGTPVTEEFAAVVIATPLHSAHIQFDGITLDQKFIKPYQRTVATFVNGVLAPVVPGEKNPSEILTVLSDTDIMFSSIGEKSGATVDSTYKVFSEKPLTQPQLDKLFSKINEVKVVDWEAYPKYSVPDTLPDFEIGPGLYYLNAIESAASAIEMSCIGGKNTALLVYYHLSGAKVPGTRACDGKFDIRRYKDEL